MQSTSSTKLVHVSTECATGSRSSLSSYLSSTRSHRVSLGHVYVFCCVLVSVVMCAAFGAVPFTNIERQVFNDVPTPRAQFTGREEAVNQLFGLSVPFAFVVNYLPKSPHANIENCAGETMVGGHASHVQIFNADHVEPPHKVSGKLVKSVGPAVSDVLMQASNFHALSLPSSTTPFASSKNALQSSQLGEITPKVARVCNAFTVRQGSKTAYPQVNTNRLPGLRQLFDFFIEAKSDKVPPGRFLDYRNRRGGTVEASAPLNVEATEAGNGEVLVDGTPLEGALGVLCGLPIALLLEGGILAELGPKSKECTLEMSERLLSRNTGHFIEPFGFLLFLQSGEHSGRLVVVNPLLFRSPCLGTNVQSPVIHVSAATEDAGKLLHLGAGWIEAISESCFHTISIHYVSDVVNTYFKKGEAAVPPLRLKPCGFPAG